MRIVERRCGCCCRVTAWVKRCHRAFRPLSSIMSLAAPRARLLFQPKARRNLHCPAGVQVRNARGTTPVTRRHMKLLQGAIRQRSGRTPPGSACEQSPLRIPSAGRPSMPKHGLRPEMPQSSRVVNQWCGLAVFDATSCGQAASSIWSGTPSRMAITMSVAVLRPRACRSPRFILMRWVSFLASGALRV